MNKIIIAVVIAFFLIGGGTYYYFQNQSSSAPLQNNQNSESAKKGSFENITGNIKDLFALNEALECTFSYDDESGSSQGNVYIAGEKMRGDFTYGSSDGQMTQAHMIRDDEYTYTWTEDKDQSQGIKIKIDESDIDVMNGETDTEKEKQADYYDFDNKDADYNCKPWVVNNSLFIPPSDIEFIDFAAQMQGFKEGLEEKTGTQCDTCNQLPAGEVRDQCLSALGCNE